MSSRIFWIFAILQSITLAVIIFLILASLNMVRGESPVGLDTRILLSVAYPLFKLLVQYVIYTRSQAG